jgi:restriction endonuclease S subunit
MASDFVNTTLRALLTFSNGRSSPVREDNLSFPVYGSNGIIGNANEANAAANTIVIGRVGSYCGSLYFSRRQCWVTDNAIRATARDDNDPRFLFYLMTALDLNGLRAGSGQPLLNQEILNRIPVNVPQPKDQRSIGHILGTLDEKIELNRRMSETLEAMTQALFKSWFIDTTDNGLPQGWRVERLGNVADLNWGDTSVTKASYTDKGFAAYSASGRDGYLPYYDFDRTGIVVSAIGANAGASWMVLGKWSCIKNTLRFWATAADVSTEYLFYATRGKNKWPMRGSAQPFIAQGDARAMEVVVPANELARRFGEITQPIHLKIKANEEEARTLAALRDSLLPKLLSGEVRVRS